MKIFIASDIHGSKNATKKLLNNFRKEKADKLVLLGDIYNHGPRNGLPDGYDPMAVADELNAVKDKLIVVRGNCDSEVDEMISEFSFVENAYLFVGGRTVFLTHGHKHNEHNLPKNADIVIYGHFHTGFIKKIGAYTVANPGSTTFPKGGTAKSYIILTDDRLVLKDEDGKIIADTEL